MVGLLLFLHYSDCVTRNPIKEGDHIYFSLDGDLRDTDFDEMDSYTSMQTCNLLIDGPFSDQLDLFKEEYCLITILRYIYIYKRQR